MVSRLRTSKSTDYLKPTTATEGAGNVSIAQIVQTARIAPNARTVHIVTSVWIAITARDA